MEARLKARTSCATWEAKASCIDSCRRGLRELHRLEDAEDAEDAVALAVPDCLSSPPWSSSESTSFAWPMMSSSVQDSARAMSFLRRKRSDWTCSAAALYASSNRHTADFTIWSKALLLALLSADAVERWLEVPLEASAPAPSSASCLLASSYAFFARSCAEIAKSNVLVRTTMLADSTTSRPPNISLKKAVNKVLVRFLSGMPSTRMVQALMRGKVSNHMTLNLTNFP
mmetsp:Transcript_86361/g.217405  ORF Transcript_86361/g.217405 Transcript_86361/m.217405 type:complete len:229 (-) Transcript_86361:1042-1728(-)